MPENNDKRTCAFEVCQTCTSICCQDAKPPLTLKRQKIIKNYLKKQKPHVENPFVQQQYCFPAVDKLGFCLFFNKETGKCLVHLVKPETCRAGPFTFDVNFQTGKVEWYLKTPAICALAGVLRENPDLLRVHFEVAREQLMNLICDLDGEALRAILRIEEPQTVKMGEENLPREVTEKFERE